MHTVSTAYVRVQQSKAKVEDGISLSYWYLLNRMSLMILCDIQIRRWATRGRQITVAVFLPTYGCSHLTKPAAQGLRCEVIFGHVNSIISSDPPFQEGQRESA